MTKLSKLRFKDAPRRPGLSQRGRGGNLSQITGFVVT